MTRARTRFGGVAVLGVVLGGALTAAQESIGTFEQITVSSTAVGLATATTNPTGRTQMNTCYARVESASLRYRDDGTDPTASVGFPQDDNDEFTITGNPVMRRIRFIRTSSTDATLNVRCYP